MASKKHLGWKRVWMVVVAFVFFIGSLALVNPAGLRVSPDETANGYFAQRFAQTLSLKGSMEDRALVFDRLHPRSTLVVDGQIVPGSFLGIPVMYGFLVMIFGSGVLWILTPLITLVAAYGWSRLLAKYLSESIGNLAGVLYLLHPAVWYYASRGLMHNLLFADLLVIGVSLWVVRPMQGNTKGPSIWNELLAGLFIGCALFVRTSEFVWVGVGLFASGLIWWHTLSWRGVRAGLFGLLVASALMLVMNHLTYGNPLTTGYTVGLPVVQELVLGETTDSLAVLPFGFHPLSAWNHFSAYFVEMFWWLFILALPGFFLLLAHRPHRYTLRWAVGIACVVSIWLVLMYGSWEIHDNPDPTQITMTNSYVRYWLPLYVFTTPMIALTIEWLAGRGRSRMAHGLIVATLVLAVVGLNVRAVFLQGQDGLIKMRAELEAGNEIQASVLRYTEEDAVIIVDRADKLFFPHRQVWYPLRDEATYHAMPALVNSAPLYYYGITFPQEDIEYLNTSKLKALNLRIELIETFDQESLYRIISS